MNKQLSKSESKYRYKFFYENHLNKFAQKNIDKLITEWGITYKGIYFVWKNSQDSCLMPYSTVDKNFQAEINKIIYHTFTTASIPELGNNILYFSRGCNKIKKRIKLVAKALQQLFQLNIIKSVCEKAVN